MKSDIHPKIFLAKIICRCGNIFEAESTKEEIHVDVCHKCHPFYTGEHRFLDTKGRVDSFQKKQQKAVGYKKINKKGKGDQKEEKKMKSLKELLTEM